MAKRKLAVVPAEPEADRSLQHYEEEFLECRGLAHSWASVGFFNDGAYVSRLVRCSRCSTEKIVTIRRDGAFVRTRYEHPEGYLIAGGGVTKADVRYEVIKRARSNTYSSLQTLRESLGGPRRRRKDAGT